MTSAMLNVAIFDDVVDVHIGGKHLLRASRVPSGTA